MAIGSSKVLTMSAYDGAWEADVPVEQKLPFVCSRLKTPDSSPSYAGYKDHVHETMQEQSYVSMMVKGLIDNFLGMWSGRNATAYELGDDVGSDASDRRLRQLQGFGLSFGGGSGLANMLNQGLSQ